MTKHVSSFLVWFWLLWLPVLAQEMPDPCELFQLTAKVVDPTQVELKWKIADDHFLFRNKFRFQTDNPNIHFEHPSYPQGVYQEVEHFGRFEVYRGQVTFTLPLIRAHSAAVDLNLVVLSQGCDDNGNCFPQHERALTLSLPELAPKTPDVGAALDQLKAAPIADPTPLDPLLGQDEANDPFADTEFLPPEQAFAPSLEATTSNTLAAAWKIAEGYYLYRHKLKFAVGGDHALQPVQIPKGEDKEDPSYGKVSVFHQYLEVPLFLEQPAPGQAVEVTVEYQGCASAGLCYPPETVTLTATMPDIAPVEQAPPPASAPAQSEQDRIANILSQSSVLVVLAAFFGFGLLLALTPCVFPMIPILSGIIVGQGDKLTPWRGFVISLVYVLAMALTYAGAGVLAGLLGESLQNSLQNPWVLTSFSLVFVLLALSMFGFYELQMPAFLQSRLTGWSNQQQGGTLAGAAIMGVLSALIVGPCVAAPLAGALLYIGQTGNWMLGGAALFVMSLGMGVPLLLVGASAGSLLPRAGGWMESVKAVFGVVLLAVAVWMMERVLPAEIIMLLWAALLIIPAMYLGALEPLPVGSGGWSRLWKGVGVLMLVYGVILLLGLAGGNKDPLQPLRGFKAGGGGAAASGGEAETAHLPFTVIHSLADLDQALATAKGRWLMLDFYADWCVSCKELEKFTFSDSRVREALKDTVLVQADVTANTADHKALMKKFQLFGPPGIIFYNPAGEELPGHRVIGYVPADPFHEHLQRVFASQ